MMRKLGSKIWFFIQAYAYSWLLPLLLTLGVLGLWLLALFAETSTLRLGGLQTALFGTLCLLWLGILVSSIWNLACKRWKVGASQLLVLLITGMVSLLAGVAALSIMMFGPDEDHFADNLTIPTGIEIAVPLEESRASRGGTEDAFQTALLDALQKPGSGDATVRADLSSLVQLQKTAPDVLWRYLASNPAWRVFRERGETYATRRWMIGANWDFPLHGYYSRITFDPFHKSSLPEFQTRLTLGLSGKPWWRGNKATAWSKAGETVMPKLSVGNDQRESHCVISLGNRVLEIMEQSENPERRLTKASLRQMEEEFRPLAEHPDEATLRKLLPPGSIQQGAPSLALRNSIQPGIYESVIWVNPGESGMIYLKAFEVTHGTPLSVDRLKESSNEWVGWSENPNEQFFSNTNFTIYEGDWGKPYAARFEVWFVPDSGKPERKLLERNFKIEGWMR